MNPYEPPESLPPPKKPKIEVDWMEFFIVLIVVVIGTPLIYSVILDYFTEWFISLSF